MGATGDETVCKAVWLYRECGIPTRHEFHGWRTRTDQYVARSGRQEILSNAVLACLDSLKTIREIEFSCEYSVSLSRE